RRDEPRRPASAADGIPASIHAGATSAARRATGHHRLDAGQRTERPDLGRQVPTRFVVCRPPIDVARSPNTGSYARLRAARYRRPTTGLGDDGTVSGVRVTERALIIGGSGQGRQALDVLE